MHTRRIAGPVGLVCALLVSACADSSTSTVPTSPSSIGAASLDKQGGNGNGNGNGNSNGRGNPHGNSNSNSNGNGNGNANGRGNPNGPPPGNNPSGPRKIEIEGLIEAIVGQVLTVNGLSVLVPPTVIVHHGSEVVPFANLHIGDRVHIKASLVLDVLTAMDVKLQNAAEGVVDGVGDTELVGVVSLFTVPLACPDATFMLGTQLVRIDVLTLPVGLCLSGLLVDGVNVHVDGNLQPDLSILATNVTILP